MKYIQTLYFNPKNDPFKQSLGWCRPEFYMMSWTLSSMQLHKIYNKVEIFTNDAGAHLLIDVLHLPYTSIHTDLNDFQTPDERLWALPKIFTYSLQDNPFLHIDGDVFIFQELPNSLTKSQLIAQNMEVETDYYSEAKMLLRDNLDYFPDCIQEDVYQGKSFYAINAGILGGHDIDFFQSYAKEAQKYVWENAHCYPHFEASKFNVFFEQHLFHALATQNGKNISCLFDNIFDDRGYSQMGNIHEAPYVRSYVHLIGHCKRDMSTCINLANKLHTLYPEAYNNIIKEFKDRGLEIYTQAYDNRTKKAQILMLSNIVTNSIKKYCTINKNMSEDMKVDYATFIKQVRMFCNQIETSIPKTQSKKVLESSIDFFYKNQHEQTNMVVKKNKYAKIIDSSYNWAGLFNVNYRNGVEYYERLDITKKGKFLNLIIVDIYDGAILLDIDEIEAELFHYINKDVTISNIFKYMEQFFDTEVITQYYAQYKSYIKGIIVKLLLVKAISIDIESSI